MSLVKICITLLCSYQSSAKLMFFGIHNISFVCILLVAEFVYSVRCNIYIKRLCYGVRLSVPEVHWRIIANLGFKF